jgi:hypothetical protein
MSEPDLIPDGDIFGDDAPPRRPRTEAEQAAAAEFEARHNHHREWLDQEYRRLRPDAQACQGSMSRSEGQAGSDMLPNKLASGAGGEIPAFGWSGRGGTR